jgi:hypothetical protein
MDTTALERKARKLLNKHGFRLQKTPARHWSRAHYGIGYQLVAPSGFIVGAERREYGMTLDKVFEHIAWWARTPAREAMLAVYKQFLADGGDPEEWIPEFQWTFYENVPAVLGEGA